MKRMVPFAASPGAGGRMHEARGARPDASPADGAAASGPSERRTPRRGTARRSPRPGPHRSGHAARPPHHHRRRRDAAGRGVRSRARRAARARGRLRRGRLARCRPGRARRGHRRAAREARTGPGRAPEPGAGQEPRRVSPRRRPAPGPGAQGPRAQARPGRRSASRRCARCRRRKPSCDRPRRAWPPRAPRSRRWARPRRGAGSLQLRSPLAGTVIERTPGPRAGGGARADAVPHRLAGDALAGRACARARRRARCRRAPARASPSRPLPGQTLQARVVLRGQPGGDELAHDPGPPRAAEPGRRAEAGHVGHRLAAGRRRRARSSPFRRRRCSAWATQWCVFVPRAEGVVRGARRSAAAATWAARWRSSPASRPGETVVVEGAFLLKAEAEKARGEGGRP